MIANDKKTNNEIATTANKMLELNKFKNIHRRVVV